VPDSLGWIVGGWPESPGSFAIIVLMTGFCVAALAYPRVARAKGWPLARMARHRGWYSYHGFAAFIGLLAAFGQAGLVGTAIDATGPGLVAIPAIHLIRPWHQILAMATLPGAYLCITLLR
jgi:hypothetical protein